MEQSVNIPCQVCAVTSTKGEITPLWCRYQDEQGEIHKLVIDEAKPTGPLQVVCNMFFECTAEVDSCKKMFVLAMDSSTRKWSIIRILL
jgi:hypothetical protein